MSEILIRPGQDADVSFISNSWLKSFRTADFVKGVPNKVYYFYHHKILEEIIPRSVVKVACNAERVDQILGWICCEPMDNAMIVHMVYVKHPFRRIGLGKKLLEYCTEAYNLDTVMYTHKTRIFWQNNEDGSEPFREVVGKRGFVYNPYLLFTTLPSGWET